MISGVGMRQITIVYHNKNTENSSFITRGVAVWILLKTVHATVVSMGKTLMYCINVVVGLVLVMVEGYVGADWQPHLKAAVATKVDWTLLQSVFSVKKSHPLCLGCSFQNKHWSIWRLSRTLHKHTCIKRIGDFKLPYADILCCTLHF